MEKQIIEKSFCIYCINKRKNCFELSIQQEGKIKTYKCINYKKNNSKLCNIGIIAIK